MWDNECPVSCEVRKRIDSENATFSLWVISGHNGIPKLVCFCLLADMDLGRESVPDRMAVICVCWPWYRPNPIEALVRARIAIDQVRLSRLATQSAIERSRDSLAQTRSALAALRSFDSTAIRRKIQPRINAMDLRKAG